MKEISIRKLQWWKVIFHVFSYIALSVLANLISFAIMPALENKIFENILFMFIQLAINISVFCIYTRVVVRKKLSFFRIKKPSKYLFLWIIIGIVIPGVVIAIYFLFNKVSLINQHPITDLEKLYFVIYSINLGITTGILEEMVFRGFVFRLLEKKWNSIVAIIIPSALFGVLHIFNMKNVDFTSVVLLIIAGTLVGIMFSMIVYFTDNIWNSVVVHGFWNIIVIGKIIKLYTFECNKCTSIFPFKIVTENILFTGGNFGIESGLPAIIVYSIVIGILILLTILKKRKQ